MPHDKHGREIEVGDGVQFAAWDAKHRVGVVRRVHASAAGCNVEIAVPVIGGSEAHTVNADMCVVLTRPDGTLVAWVNATTEGGEHTTMSPYQEIDPTQEAPEAPPAEAPTPEPEPPADATTEF